MSQDPEARENAVDRVVAKTPWWAFSTGLHVLAALILGYLVVLATPPGDVEEIVVRAAPRRIVTPIMDPPPAVREKPPLVVPQESQSDVEIKRPEIAETPESDDNEDFDSFKGQSEEFKSTHPFNSKSFNDTLGAGGGAAGRYGKPYGGRRDRGSKASKAGQPACDAVLEALKWLARHQAPDGSWSTTGYSAQCGRPHPGLCTPAPGNADYDTGNTALSLLAFLGAGYTHLSKDHHDGICFGTVVRKGLQWMMTHQDPEGCVGPRTVPHYMYNHAIATYAFGEAYGMTGSNLFADSAQNAVNFLVAAQNPGKAWRYTLRSGDNDSSVTGWCVMALKSAEMSGLSFPASAYEGARAWFTEATEESYYRTGYTHKGTGQVYNESNRHFDHHETLTAIAMMSRLFMDRRADAAVTGGGALLVKDLPRWDGNAIDFYYWYSASFALFQLDGPHGPMWSRWNAAMKDSVIRNQCQKSSGCKNGSWEPVDRWSGEGGRVYATAINALTLEVYYRYANVMINR